ncbi:pyridoxamine 5'-phosphate oxidase [Halostreptopolyspora alba]|uniref:Pyridoxine/pyridoxamine 5'-phosphate oxidase n=1 Tax=Halostreptopolyspora alba TaxID=2487137 RepID=A0A3N0E818_9ACTN|nr:pyridoxamine 5'-phosphate oxidase [Nocardiopsaceae bacterium YIM 96095]
MNQCDFADLREPYEGSPLRRDDLAAHPMEQFHVWFTRVRAAGLGEPNAMVLATVEPRGVPRARTVLLKGYDRTGLRFFTNYRSRKGTALLENPNVSVVFPWHPVRCQVSVSGRAERLSDAENDAYFATRPRGSRIGAWASESQSSPVTDREELEERFRRCEDAWAEYAEIPRPDYWGGFRILPTEVEFWQGQADRMHDRFRYRLRSTERDGEGWEIERLSP